MQNSAHTEGEWNVEAKNLIKCNGEQIGSANSMIDEYEANAKVMAAAPDLLKALDELQHEVQMQCSIGSDPRFLKMCELWQNAKQAINKATK